MDQYGLWQLRLVEKRKEYGAVHTFAFDPLSPMPFVAGQYIHLAAVADNWEKPLVRHMSIASPPTSRHLEFTMDLGSGTDYKRAMGALAVGDRVAAFKLKGEFVVAEERRGPLVFIAGGLGITPIRSILRDLEETAPEVTRSLFHVARDAHLFEDELSSLTLRQKRTDRAGLDALWPEILAAGGETGTYYLCGSLRFVEGLLSRLYDSGVLRERIIIENFR